MTERSHHLQAKELLFGMTNGHLTPQTLLEAQALIGSFCIGGLIRTRDTSSSGATIYNEAPIIILPRRLRLKGKEKGRTRKKRSIFYIMTNHGTFGLEISIHERRPLIGKGKKIGDVAKAIQRSRIRNSQSEGLSKTYVRYRLSRPEEICLHGNTFSPTHEKYRIIEVRTKKQTQLFLRAIEKNIAAVS